MPARFSAGIAVVPMMLSPSILVFCTTVPWKPRDCGRETSKPCWFLISTEGRYRSVSLTVLSCRFSIKSCGTDVKENGVSSSLRSPRGPRLTLSAPYWGPLPHFVRVRQQLAEAEPNDAPSASFSWAHRWAWQRPIGLADRSEVLEVRPSLVGEAETPAERRRRQPARNSNLPT